MSDSTKPTGYTSLCGKNADSHKVANFFETFLGGVGDLVGLTGVVKSITSAAGGSADTPYEKLQTNIASEKQKTTELIRKHNLLFEHAQVQFDEQVLVEANQIRQNLNEHLNFQMTMENSKIDRNTSFIAGSYISILMMFMYVTSLPLPELK